MFQSLVASNPAKPAGRSVATAVSVVIHSAIIGALIYMPVHAASTDPTEGAVLVALPKDEPLPLPPDVEVSKPAPSQALPAPIGFRTLAMPDIVPTDIPAPQVGVQINAEDYNPRGVAGGEPDSSGTRRSASDLTAAPFVTPTDIAPKLLNRDVVASAISRNYPPLLRDAGIGGTTKVWFYIDENGRSTRQLVKTPSGFATLDSAALRVAPEMRFTPAMTHDKAVAVWVAIDIVFKIR